MLRQQDHETDISASLKKLSPQIWPQPNMLRMRFVQPLGIQNRVQGDMSASEPFRGGPLKETSSFPTKPDISWFPSTSSKGFPERGRQEGHPRGSPFTGCPQQTTLWVSSDPKKVALRGTPPKNFAKHEHPKCGRPPKKSPLASLDFFARPFPALGFPGQLCPRHGAINRKLERPRLSPARMKRWFASSWQQGLTGTRRLRRAEPQLRSPRKREKSDYPKLVVR